MIREIKRYPEPVLKKKAQEVQEIIPEVKELAEDLMETMLKSDPKGVGLAAPQIGISKRIFAVQTENGSVVYINPEIIKKSREAEVMEEGCLSLPRIWLKIKRAKEVEIKALDINGKKINIKAAGLFARILQHEIDHLNGILIIDKISFWQKIKRSLTKGE